MHLYDVMITCYSHNHMRNTVYVRMGGGGWRGWGGSGEGGGLPKKTIFFFPKPQKKTLSDTVEESFKTWSSPEVPRLVCHSKP